MLLKLLSILIAYCLNIFDHVVKLPKLGSGQMSFIDRKEVVSRVLDVVKKFPKIDIKKVSATSHFTTDLGLDSLDQVELVMSFEDEFKLEIPDADAEKIQTCDDAIKYIAAHPQAK